MTSIKIIDINYEQDAESDVRQMVTFFVEMSFIFHWSTNFNFFFLARTLTTDSYRVWATDSESVLRFSPSHQVFELFDILYCLCLYVKSLRFMIAFKPIENYSVLTPFKVNRLFIDSSKKV